MEALADDPTAAAILATIPCYPVPPTGRSPGIDALRAARAGHGLAIGQDGVMLVLRRPWLALDARLATPLPAYLPFGSVGRPGAILRCGLIPAELLDRIVDHFAAALPNEAAAFVIWNEETRVFAVEFPDIGEATPSRLVYRPPVLAPGWHIVCDVHSHGNGRAYFSSTDDADDAHSTKIAVVIGQLAHEGGPELVGRICAGGMFIMMPRSPFAGDYRA